MKYDEKKYRKAINDLADQLCAMVKEDYDSDGEGDHPGKEHIWDESADNTCAAHQDLDEAMSDAYDRVFK